MSKRRRNCTGCGKWLTYGDDELCRDCDPECALCDERQSEHDKPFVDGKCAECIAFEQQQAES